MTDLPADPRFLNDETGADGYVPPRGSGRSAAVASGGPAVPPKPVKVVPTEPAAEAADEGDAPAAPVVYDSLATLVPRTPMRTFVGPLLGVALVGVGLGFLLARTAGTTDANKTTRTVVTPPPRLVPSTAAAPAVLGTNVQAGTTTAAGTTAAPAPTTAAPVTAAPTSAAPSPTTAPAPTAAPVPTLPAPTGPAVVSGVDVAAPVRFAEFSAGKVYLHGRVPSEELRATIRAKVGAVVGPDNVFDDYVVDPSTPAVAGGPLKVLDTVQFEPDSAVLRPAFTQILDLGLVLMNLNPNVTITVVGRSDPRGSASYNEDLSRRRAGAVVQYLVSRGIDSDRLTIDARGSSDPLALGDDAAANQANRSVEFVILGLID